MLKIDNQRCTGCRACQVACSFHHRKVFNPKIASLEVHRDEKRGMMTVVLYPDLTQERQRKRHPCDLCVDEEQPLCVKYCAPGAIVAA